MGSNPTISVLEHSKVSPPTTIAELSLPLTFFDMLPVNYEQVLHLLFYDFPHPKSHFLHKIIPNLKTSLSLALQHFLPVAGKLIYPLNTRDQEPILPTLRYVAGDSVPIIFAECCEDFVYLKGNHARDSEIFYPLVPQMPPATTDASGGYKAIPLLAVQVTLFPNVGVAIGTNIHHVIGDASTMTQFMRLWASINKARGDAHLLPGELPFFDRSMIKDSKGLDTLLWKKMRNSKQIRPPPIALHNVRATFIIGNSDIKKLKSLLLSKRSDVVHVSSFVVTCAYVWTCYVKARAVTNEEATKDDELEYLTFAAECRGRLDPPIAATYFGNCFVNVCVASTHAQLIGKDGFLIAAKSIGDAIHKKFYYNKEEISRIFEAGFSEIRTINRQRGLGVSDSPKFDVYDADYGWGQPEQYEYLNVDDGMVSFNKCNKSEGGLEVGLALPKMKMDAFATIFGDSLIIL